MQIAGRLPDSERSRECKIDLFNAIVPETDQDREPLVRRHLAELADTPIQPRIDVDLRGVRGRAKVDARSFKGSLSRLKPYAAAFVGGCVFMLALMLVLLPAISGSWSFKTLWGSSPLNDTDPLAKRAEALDARAADIRRGEDELAKKAEAYDRKSKELSDGFAKLAHDRKKLTKKRSTWKESEPD